MASIDQIIKDLEDIRDSGGARGTGGGTTASRRTAALQAKEALANSREFNKNTKQRLDLEIKALRIAQNQYKLDEKEYKVIGGSLETNLQNFQCKPNSPCNRHIIQKSKPRQCDYNSQKSMLNVKYVH